MAKPMTRKRLENHLKDQAEVNRLSRVVSGKVTDKVKGSLDEHPYTETSVTVAGLDEKLMRRYRQKKRKTEAERKAILAFVNGIEDLYMADLIQKRYLEQKSWVDIWKANNCNGSIDGYRVMVRRYLEKM